MMMMVMMVMMVDDYDEDEEDSLRLRFVKAPPRPIGSRLSRCRFGDPSAPTSSNSGLWETFPTF